MFINFVDNIKYIFFHIACKKNHFMDTRNKKSVNNNNRSAATHASGSGTPTSDAMAQKLSPIAVDVSKEWL